MLWFMDGLLHFNKRYQNVCNMIFPYADFVYKLSDNAVHSFFFFYFKHNIKVDK